MLTHAQEQKHAQAYQESKMDVIGFEFEPRFSQCMIIILVPIGSDLSVDPFSMFFFLLTSKLKLMTEIKIESPL